MYCLKKRKNTRSNEEKKSKEQKSVEPMYYMDETPEESIIRQNKCNELKKKLGCFFLDLKFEERVVDYNTREPIKIVSLLQSGFNKCWITKKPKRDDECLFHVEINNYSGNKKYTWKYIVEFLCDGNEDEANNRLIQTTRPERY